MAVLAALVCLALFYIVMGLATVTLTPFLPAELRPGQRNRRKNMWEIFWVWWIVLIVLVMHLIERIFGGFLVKLSQLFEKDPDGFA